MASFQRTILIGTSIIQKSDGTWTGGYRLDVSWAEHMPSTPEEARDHVQAKCDQHPSIKAIADGVDVNPDPITHAVAMLDSIHASKHPALDTWKKDFGVVKEF